MQTCCRPVQITHCLQKKKGRADFLFFKFVEPFWVLSISSHVDSISLHFTYWGQRHKKCCRCLRGWKRWHKLCSKCSVYMEFCVAVCVCAQMAFMHICVCVHMCVQPTHVCLCESVHSWMCMLDQDVETLCTLACKGCRCFQSDRGSLVLTRGVLRDWHSF